MKKIALLLVLTACLAVGAFADHPSGWGVGIMGQYGFAWDGFTGNAGAALSLKAPQLPIYWGINMDIYHGYFGLGVTGDYYLIDQRLVDSINFGWYFGVGGYAGLGFYGDLALSLGARLPIGIYLIPLETDALSLELFLDIAPSLGLQALPSFHFPAGDLGVDMGLRLWF